MNDINKRGVAIAPSVVVKSKREKDGMFYLEVGPFLYPHAQGAVSRVIKETLLKEGLIKE